MYLFRTAVNSQSGVKTPAGGVFTGGLVLIALALLTPWFYFIPNAALAGVIIMAVLDMVSFQLLKRLWRVKRKCAHRHIYRAWNFTFKFCSLCTSLVSDSLEF